MRPTQLLDCQADLYDRLLTVPLLQRVIADILSRSHASGTAREAALAGPNARALVNGLAKAVRQADCYRVKADMCALVQHAAAMLDETDLTSPDLAPSPFGMVFFEEPLPVLDARGKTLLAHWLVWGRAAVATSDEPGAREEPGTASWWFNDALLQPDEISRDLVQTLDPKVLGKIGRWHLMGADVDGAGRPVGTSLTDVALDQRLKIQAEGDTPHAFTNTSRYLHALWMLLGQTVATVAEEDPSRKSLKRARQMGLPGRVTVVTLRRSEGSRQPGESMVEWRHRWIVKGHPRWQPYGERTACSHALGPVEVSAGHSVRRCLVPGCSHEVRRIWISPYIKGPDSLPIRQSEKVYDLAR